MDIKKIALKYLNWEKDNKMFEISINGFPIYSLIRLEMYESIIFNSSLNKIFNKSSNSSNVKINYFKIIINAVKFFKKSNILNKSFLFVTNTENKVFLRNNYVDNIFDKIISIAPQDSSFLEFPNLSDYHFDNVSNKSKIVEGDIFFVLEKLVKGKIDKKKLNIAIEQISESYTHLYEDVYKKKLHEDIKIELKKRIVRNLERLFMYKLFIKIYKPKKVFLKSSYSPMKQLLIYACKKTKTEIIELQHGHIYPLHIGYLLPFDVKMGYLSPDKILVWSNYYADILRNNRWESEIIVNVGDFTYNKELNENITSNNLKIKELGSKYEVVITIISQHTLDFEFLKYLKTVNKLPRNVLVVIKLHPKYIQTQKIRFDELVKKHKNVLLVEKGNLKEYLEISDLVVGVYSTGIIEAIEMNIPTHLLEISISHFFDDLLKREVVYASSSIEFSYNLFSKKPKNNTIIFREKFKAEYCKEIFFS